MSNYKHLFGPVPSRRLGRSLGVDIVPLKVCSQNCIYCQLGVNADTKVERAEYVSIADVLAELKDAVNKGLDADYITLTGSGEPTLNSRIGDLIDGIRLVTDIPVAILTNGTLLSNPEVREACSKADLVSPSFDAGDEDTFMKMNRPDASLSFDVFLDGLCEFRREYEGQIWLEVFFCDGVNTDVEQVEKIKSIIERIDPDKVQLNTSVRPVVEKNAVRVEKEKLEQIAMIIGDKAEVIANFSRLSQESSQLVEVAKVLELLRRRPCRLEDICNGLGAGRNEIAKIISILELKGSIYSEQLDSGVYYKVKS